MWLMLRGLSKTRVGAGGLLDVKPQATVWFGKEATEKLPAPGVSASTWQLVERVAGGGRGKHAVKARSLLLQNNSVIVSMLLHRHLDVSAVFLAGKEASLGLLCLLSPCCCYHSFFPKCFSQFCQSLWCLKSPYILVNRPWYQLHTNILR